MIVSFTKYNFFGFMNSHLLITFPNVYTLEPVWKALSFFNEFNYILYFIHYEFQGISSYMEILDLFEVELCSGWAKRANLHSTTFICLIWLEPFFEDAIFPQMCMLLALLWKIMWILNGSFPFNWSMNLLMGQ